MPAEREWPGMGLLLAHLGRVGAGLVGVLLMVREFVNDGVVRPPASVKFQEKLNQHAASRVGCAFGCIYITA